MSKELIYGAEVVAMFCRLNINSKKDLPIRSSEMGLLILICQSEEVITPVKAAEFFKVKKPMITSMVINLCKQGYITKVALAQDKRSFQLLPTNKAIQLVSSTYQEYLKVMELLSLKLQPENYAVLIDLLGKANQIMLKERTNG
jgi:DNA-binding MarR family transcriptional regulator